VCVGRGRAVCQCRVSVAGRGWSGVCAVGERGGGGAGGRGGGAEGREEE
jgi:hypothetical protein